MRSGAVSCTVVATMVLASCSFGPRLQSALPVVRDVPVLAGLSPQDSLARARTYLASRQYGLAIELFRAAGRDPALELDSLNGLAIAYDGIGRGDLAERYFQKALALRTDDPRTRRNLSAFYAASGQQAKRQALLADANIDRPAEATVAIADTFVAEAKLPTPASVGPGSSAPNMAHLRAPSPLGGAFQPLIVKAGLSGRAPLAQASPSSDPSIICTGSPGAAKTPSAGDPMTMFRISVGEVFITTQPDGTSCAVAESVTALRDPQGMSNKQYLGLVAAYLDQLNRLQLFAQLALPATSGIS
jgi:tetratricopeptide (TPR) repeat protein